MSRDNIVNTVQTLSGGIIIYFATKDGGVRAYKYNRADAEAFANGADPRTLSGTEIN